MNSSMEIVIFSETTSGPGAQRREGSPESAADRSSDVPLLCETLWHFMVACCAFWRAAVLALWDILHFTDPFKQSTIRFLEARVKETGLRDDLRADAYMSLAYLYCKQRGKKGLVQEYFHRARRLYSDAQSHTVEKHERWLKEPSPLTKLGILHSSPLYEGHDLKKAFVMFGDAMRRYGCQHAAYWRGRAFLNGFGTEQTIEHGYDLIQQAEASGVLRAKLEIAALFEEGYGCIRKNPALAKEYYLAISLTPRGKEPVEVESLDRQDLAFSAPLNKKLAEQEWVRDFALSHLLHGNELLDKEDVMGLNIGSLLSWEFAGQAFLVGATATLTSTTILNASLDLQHIIPIIGIAIGILSFFSSLSTALKNDFRRHDLGSMFEAKVDACERLVPRPPLSQFWWEHGIRLQSALATISDLCAVGLSLLFIGVWSKWYSVW